MRLIGDLSLSGLYRQAAAAAGPFGGHATLGDGLVSYWPLGEESGVRADIVGSNDLTDNNTVGYANLGPIGVVARGTNADDDYLSHATVGTFAAGESRTWSFWWKDRTAGATSGSLIARDNGTTREWAIRTGNTTLQLLAFDGAGNVIVNGDSFTDFSETFGKNAWHFGLVWFDSSDNTMKYRVDGGTVRSYSAGADVRGGSATTTFLWSQFYANADLELARVGHWTTVLGTTEQDSLYNSGLGKSYADLTAAEKVGLVSYWNLDEASGNRADSHGSNTLTDNNTVTSVDNTHPGFGKAASFVAANSEYLSLASQSVITSGQARTVAFWLNRTATAGANDTHFLIGNSVGDGSRLIDIVGQGSDPNSQLTLFVNGTSTPSAGFYSAGQWMLVVYTYDGATTHKIYVDTTERVSYTGGDSGNSGAMFVGNGPASPADMLMGALGVWSRVLTAQERTDLYAAGAGLFYED